MPWSVADVERHSAGLSPRSKQQWVAVANSALARCQRRGGKSCDVGAIRMANAVVHASMVLEAAARGGAGDAKVKATTPIEKVLRAQLAKAFNKQRAEFLNRLARHHNMMETAHLRESDPVPDWESAWSDTELETIDVFTLPLTEAQSAAMEAGIANALATFALTSTFDLNNPIAQRYLQTHGAELVSAINDETRARLNTLLLEARVGGWDYTKTASAIRELFDGFSAPSALLHIVDRAELIAVTEVARAYEFANWEVVNSLTASGLAMQKSWLTVGDDRVDEDCQSYEDMGWVTLDTSFGGDDTPPAHPGCRCTTEYQMAPQEGT